MSDVRSFRNVIRVTCHHSYSQVYGSSSERNDSGKVDDFSFLHFMHCVLPVNYVVRHMGMLTMFVTCHIRATLPWHLIFTQTANRLKCPLMLHLLVPLFYRLGRHIGTNIVYEFIIGTCLACIYMYLIVQLCTIYS